MFVYTCLSFFGWYFVFGMMIRIQKWLTSLGRLESLKAPARGTTFHRNMGRAGWQPACSSLLVPVWRYAGRHAGIYKLCRGRDFQSSQSLCQAFQPLEHPRDTRCVPRLCLWCLSWRCGGGCWSCSRDADRLVASRCWFRWMTNRADMLLCSEAARQDLHLSICLWAMQWYAMYSDTRSFRLRNTPDPTLCKDTRYWVALWDTYSWTNTSNC